MVITEVDEIQRKGFTLLEVVLAIAIISILSVFLLRIVSGAINISDNVSEKKEKTLETAGRSEAEILRGTARGTDSYTIPIRGSSAGLELTQVEEMDEKGNVFRIYIPKIPKE